jgi:hypothetical protein
MAYNDEQNEYPVPGNDNIKRTSAALLPRYFRTDTNKKFIGSTLDQLTNPGVVEKLNGFVGSREAKAVTIDDSYISDTSAAREDYQLEPFAIINDDLGNTVFDADYLDILGQINAFGGNNKNHDKLFSQEFYAWDPHIDFDKFTNFREYYWLPNGPQEVPVKGQGLEVTSTYTIDTVTDGNATTYRFDGLTRNKTLSLYRGQTYNFEINTVGQPISIATSRSREVIYGDDSELLSTIYSRGVTLEHNRSTDTLVNKSDYLDEGFIEDGVLTFTVPTDAPDILYYVSQTDINNSGIFRIYDIEENSAINVSEEIIGKKTYRTVDGWDFSNGMKVYFQGTVTPESYASGLYYVEGVGEHIDLVPVQNLEVPAIFTSDTQVPFDANGFDRVPFSDARSYAATKDYICINRRDTSRNAWARYNRWTHKSVIEKSAEINNQPINLDQDSRAKRPIIEFEPGLRLYNHGLTAKLNVDVVDTFTTDVFSTIEGSIGYNIDGIDVVNGMRILFTADPDSLVNGKIFEAKFIRHNNVDQISLVETDDTDPVENETVLVKTGNKNAGQMFWYNGTEWKSAQNKTAINQAPRFDLFDTTGHSLGDQDVYDSTDFTGNRIFSYKVGEGTNDTELGFPITYQNFVNIGDIVFDFDLLNKTYQYKVNNLFQNLNSDIYYLQKNTKAGITYVNGWKKANEKSHQYVVRKYTGEEYTNGFPIDVYNGSATLDDLVVKVWVNNEYIADTEYRFENINAIKTVVLDNDINFTDIVVIKTRSHADKNDNGYYEIPHNFERNPSNNNLVKFTLGEVNDHVQGLVAELESFTGQHPGASNLRDLGPVKQFGRKFIQHSGPLNLPLYHLTTKNANIISAIRYAANEYQKFKRQFIQTATESSFSGNVKDHVDQILNTLNFMKTESMPFYSTDMAGTGGSKKIEYEILDFRVTTYALSAIFDKTTISNKALTVYLNHNQLTHGIDYTFTGTGFVDISATLTNGDKLVIHEYDNTEGSFIPPTPTKLGMYPSYMPEKFADNTYKETVNVLRGHDGSIIVAFDDYRDDLILELEKRIYNNLKTAYNPDIFDIHDIVGGIDRNTQVSKATLDQIMIKDFIDWTQVAKVSDYTENSFIVQGEPFTYNYRGSKNVRGDDVPGYWRGIYRQAYDTDRPHTHPWEMLGYSVKPSWWEDQYGPAPYTRDNLILWTDLQNGTIREPNQPVTINKKYVRHSLLKHIPVDENGQLLSPLDSGYVNNFSFAIQRNNTFKFGDEAPAETAWIRSSAYPFSVMIASIITRPAHTMGIGFDRSRMSRCIAGNLVYSASNKRINTASLVFPKVDFAVTGGFINYIAEYINSNTEFEYTSYTDNVKRITNKIGFKLAGFADKNKLKLVLDSKTPLNQGNVFVPPENYDIVLRKSSPQEIVTYSGVIVEKVTNGFKISGYDKEQPYFTYYSPQEISSDPFVNVGGISESFIEWDENKQYIAGKIVRYENKYYRVNVTHTTEQEFDISFYSPLASLPETGGTGAYFRKNFFTMPSTIDYGTVLNDAQSVVDFILGYQAYLKYLGFKFEYFNKQTEAVENWNLSAKEFLFWTTQNWSTNSLISLSPSANRAVFERDYFVVDDVYDNLYRFAVLNENNGIIKKSISNIYRDSTNMFNLTSEEGVYLLKLPLIQKEHLVLVDNTTVFNDTIYAPETGYRQERLKVVGYRTDDWNGNLNIPGFIYDQAEVTDWESYKDYKTAELVKYKEFYYAARFTHSGTEVFQDGNWARLPERPQSSLKPNWDYRANQFTDFYDLDTDNFDSEQQRLAQHLIGYQKREYLANIIQDDISQYKFYQGFIQDKGTSNSITKLFDKLGANDKDSVELYEEWAVRVGRYGATTSFDETEYVLDESKFRIEPQLIEFVEQVDDTRVDLVYQLPRKDVYLKPENYNHSSLPTDLTLNEYTKTAGYVTLNQVDFVAKNINDMLVLDIDSVDIGMHIWVTQDEDTWGVYQHEQAKFNIISIEKTDLGFKANFDRPIPLEDGDFIGLNNISPEINGFWVATNVNPNREVLTDSTINHPSVEIVTDNSISTDAIDLEDSTLGIVTILCERRLDNPEQINLITKEYDLTDNKKVWVDNIGDGNFGVYTSNIIRSFSETVNNPESSSRKFGDAIAVSGNNTTMAVGTPDKDNGKVYVYTRSSEAQNFTLKQTLEPLATHHDGGEFGDSVAISKDGQYLYVGAPTASNVLSRYKGQLDPVQPYLAGDIVSSKGTLWRAKNNITVESSTIDLESKDWELVNIIPTDTEGTSLGYANQGVVYIYRRLVDQSFALVQIICSSQPAADEKFGIAVKVTSPADFEYNLFVRAVGNNGRLYLIYNEGQTSVLTYGYSRDTNYKGEWFSTRKYIENNIVYNDGVLYQANTLVPAGNAFDTNQWDVLDSYIDYTGFLPPVLDVSDLLDEDSSGFGLASAIGSSFDISANSQVLALGGVISTEYRIAIYRKVGDRFVFDQNIDSPTDLEYFGTTISLNADGSKLAIGAQASNVNGLLNGAVYVYKSTNGVFSLDQTLTAPDGEKNERFGVYVKFDEQKLAVTSVAGDTGAFVTFDTDTTHFDNKATNILDEIKNNGQVYIFETLDNKLILAEKLYTQVDIRDAIDPFGYLNRNHLYVSAPGAPAGDNIGLVSDYRANINANAWQLDSSGDNHVVVDKIKGVWLYDKTTNDLITYLDYIDPIKGRIAGPAEQELSYKLYYDPAVYNIGTTTTGSLDLWGADNVGKLWWDISAIKWYNPYQGNIQYKSNTWNSIIPGFSVDVYEWVESEYLPSEWDALADTTEGLAEGISGLTKYSDDRYVRSRKYDPVSNSFIPVYYYWVKNKTTIPDTYGRKLASLDIANLIADPAGQGYRFVAILDDKKLALHNVKSLIKDTDTILHIDYYVQDNAENKNIHSEYELLVEGLGTSKPNADIVDKWISSLAGYDSQNNPLPDVSVSLAHRYGILNTPNQSMFVNRTEALKQVIERVNGILATRTIVDDFDISPLLTTDPEPSKFSRQWDVAIDSENLLRFVGTAKITQATLTPEITDGVITNVTITNPGRGYVDSNYVEGNTRQGPTVTIEGTGEGAELKTYINNLGQITSVEILDGGKNYLDNTSLIVRPFSVLVKNDSDVGGLWAVYNWISSTQEWFRNYIQDYDVNLYWDYKDWYATGYNEVTRIDFVVPGSYALSGLNDKIGNIVKIETIGTGGWLLLEKIDNQPEVDYTVNYKVVGRQNGTLAFSSLLYQNSAVGFDAAIYDTSLYDREPTEEIKIILRTIIDNIFVDELETEWNKLFFASIRYAMSEQVDLDWIFKSSFVVAKHNVGELEQKITYQNDNLPNYQDYINEVKPYSTKIREYISSYGKVEPTQTSVTDFDLPPRYDPEQGKIISETIKFFDNAITGINNTTVTYPQKHWLDNVGFEIKDFVIYDGGAGYTETAQVTISGGGGPTLTGNAYIGGNAITFIEVDTVGAKYFTTPQVTIDASKRDEDGRDAIVYAQIGNSLVRSSHILMKFDRTLGEYYFTTLDETETFVGNGGLTEFDLKWPSSTRVVDVEVVVDGEVQLTSDYTITNELDTSKGYDRYRGRINFHEAPIANAAISIDYKKATSLLTAADRINFFYKPTTNMPGTELAQLMDGVDYGGVQMDSVRFGENEGYDAEGFGENFDTFDTNYEDEIITLDGSTQIVELANPLESGVTYNVYLNNVRIDDPAYDGSSVVTNPNAKMVSPVGDDITAQIFLDSDVITTTDGDIIIVRKSTSDGSYSAGSTAFDVSLQGGNFEYTTAAGIDAADIIVDGDGFVTETTSKGPEENVPGQVLDTLDIQVYNRQTDGNGIIDVRNYITDGATLEYEFGNYPQANTTIIITLNGRTVDLEDVTIDWENKTVSWADSTALPAEQNLSILTIGVNGVDVIDSDAIISTGTQTRYDLPIKFKTTLSAFVTINGVVQVLDQTYGLRNNDGYLQLEFPASVDADAIINYTIYDGTLNKYSQMVIDTSMVTDGVNKVHRFVNDVELPGVTKPISHNILVQRGDGTFLNAGYRKKHNVTSERAYDIDRWQFEDYTLVRNSDVICYLNGSIMDRKNYLYDVVNGRVQLLNNNVGMIGDTLEILIIKDAEYFFYDTVVVVEDLNDEVDYDGLEIGVDVTFATADDSTSVVTCVQEKLGKVDTKSKLISNVTATLDTDGLTYKDFRITTTVEHGFKDKDEVVIEGIGGTEELNRIRRFYVKVIDNNTLELYFDSNTDSVFKTTVYSAYTSGGTIIVPGTKTFRLQSYVRDLLQIQSLDDTPPIILGNQVDSTIPQAVRLKDVYFMETDELTLLEAPAEWETVNIYTFSNHDINNFERTSLDIVWNTTEAPAGTQAYIDKNLLSRGYIALSTETLSANYVWVFKNGQILTPQVDYHLAKSKTGVQLYDKVTSNDRVEVLHFAANPSDPKFGFRIFKDMLNRYHYKRLNKDNEYQLAQPLNYYDTFIELKDSTGIQSPNRALGLPGVVFIDKERIEYFAVDGQLLRQLRRGTLGTGIKPQYPAATLVQGQGIEESIPYADETTTTTFIGDTSSKQFILDFVPGSVNEIDVFLGGVRLRKDNVVTFDKTIDLDSPEADVTLAPEYTIENIIFGGNTVTALYLADYIDPPADGTKIVVTRKTGKKWTDDDKTLADSQNEIARFIKDKTISLPR